MPGPPRLSLTWVRANGGAAMPWVYQSPPNSPEDWEDEYFQSALDEVVPPRSTAKRVQAAEEYRALINELKQDAAQRKDSRSPKIGPTKQAALKLAKKSEALARDFRNESSALEVGAATFNPRDTNPTDQETEDFIALVASCAHQLDEISATLQERANRYSPNVDAMTIDEIRFGTEIQAIAAKAKHFFRHCTPEKLTKIQGGPFHTFIWITYQLVYGRLTGKAGEEPRAKFLSTIRQVLKEPPSIK